MEFQMRFYLKNIFEHKICCKIFALKYVMHNCTYNVHGLNQCNWAYIEKLVDNNDFVLLQELWLHSSEARRIQEHLHGVGMHFVSGMADDELHA